MSTFSLPGNLTAVILSRLVPNGPAGACSKLPDWERRRAAIHLYTAVAILISLGPTARAESINLEGAISSSSSLPSSGDSFWDAGYNLYIGALGSGRLTIKGGGIVQSSQSTIGYHANASGSSVIVSGTDGAGNASTWKESSYISVGYKSNGSLTIEDGATVTSMYGFIAEGAGVSGSVTVSGTSGTGIASTWNNKLQFFVGYRGTGTLIIKDGGKVSNTLGYIADSAGTAGSSVVVSGIGSTWTNSHALTVGKSDSGTLTIADGGLVSASQVDLSTGYGTLNIGTTSGPATATAGTLAAAEVKFGGSSSLNFNYTGSTTFSAALSGGSSASAVNHRAGITTLTGDSSAFGGMTTLTGGTLIVGDASGTGKLGGTINVGSGSTLGGTGNIGSASTLVSIASGGVHAPGNSIGTQTVLGNYVNHGVLRVEANPTAADRIEVLGDVDISNATLDLVLSPITAADWNHINGPFTIIDKKSAGAVTGTFGSVAQNMLFLDASVAYNGGDGNDVTLSLARNGTTFASFGGTGNQIATAAAIDGLRSSNAIWNAIAGASDADVVRQTFDILSGEIHSSARTARIEDSRNFRNAINSRIRSALDEAGAYAPVLAYAADAHPVLVPPVTVGATFWSQGFGSWGSTSSDGNAANLDRSSAGFLIGADSLVGDWRIGSLVGYSHSGFEVTERASSGQSDAYHLGLYGGTNWGALGLRTGAAYTFDNIKTRRAVEMPGISETLRAAYAAGTLQAFGELGYGIDIDHSRVEPFVNLAYANLHDQGFREHGGAAALSGGGSNTGVAFTTVGLRAEHNMALDTIYATARGMIGWQRVYGDTTPTSNRAFSAGDAFAVAGASVARDTAILEAGLDLNFTQAATLGLAYDGQIGAYSQDHGFKLDLNVRF